MIACCNDSRTFQNEKKKTSPSASLLASSAWFVAGTSVKLTRWSFRKASLGKGDGTHLSNISSLSNINLSLTNIRMKLWQTFGLFDVWNLPRSQSSTALWQLRTSRNQKHEDRPRMKQSKMIQPIYEGYGVIISYHILHYLHYNIWTIYFLCHIIFHITNYIGLYWIILDYTFVFV